MTGIARIHFMPLVMVFTAAIFALALASVSFPNEPEEEDAPEEIRIEDLKLDELPGLVPSENSVITIIPGEEKGSFRVVFTAGKRKDIPMSDAIRRSIPEEDAESSDTETDCSIDGIVVYNDQAIGNIDTSITSGRIK